MGHRKEYEWPRQAVIILFTARGCRQCDTCGKLITVRSFEGPKNPILRNLTLQFRDWFSKASYVDPNPEGFPQRTAETLACP